MADLPLRFPCIKNDSRILTFFRQLNRPRLRILLMVIGVTAMLALFFNAYRLSVHSHQWHTFNHRAQQADALQEIASLLARRRGLQAIVDSGNTEPQPEIRQLNQMLAYSLRPLIHERQHLEGAYFQHVQKLRDCLAVDCFRGSENSFEMHSRFIRELLNDARVLLSDEPDGPWLREHSHVRKTVSVLTLVADFAEKSGQFRGRYSAGLQDDAELQHAQRLQAGRDMARSAAQFFQTADSELVQELGLASYLERTRQHYTQIQHYIDTLQADSASADSLEFFRKFSRFISDLNFIGDQIAQHLYNHSSSEIDLINDSLFYIWSSGLLLLFALMLLLVFHLRSSQRRTLDSNLQLSFLKDALDEHAIVSVTDAQGNITSVNPKFVAISGYEEAELLGQNHRIISSGLHAKSFFKQLWDHVHQNKVWSGEVCNRRKDGSLYWVYATVLPLYNAQQELVSVISVRTDITAQKESAELLRKEKDKADAANQAKSDFLANMSHEIRTPMNAVIGMTHLALQQTQDPKTLNYLNKIKISANNLLDIINDILDFSKIEAGKIRLEEIEFVLKQTLQQVVDVSQVKASEKSLPVRLECRGELPEIAVSDPLRLSQVLLNLLSNAVKFTEKGSVTLQVTGCKTAADDYQLTFEVIDTGIGISYERQQHLFEAFSQEDSSTTRLYGGTGLGLSISQQLTRLLGGELELESTPGAGSSFRFTLNMRTPVNVRGKRNLQDLKAVYIDDEEISLQSAEGLFSAQGITLECSSEVQATLDHIVYCNRTSGENAYDLVVVDQQMQEMDGVTFTRKLRELLPPKQQPLIVLLTGQNHHELSQWVESRLFDSIWFKPVAPSEILDSLQELLQSQARGFSSTLAPLPEPDECNIRQLLGARVLVAEDNSINQEVITGLLEPYGLDITLVENGALAVDAMKQQIFDLVLMDLQMPVMDGLTATRHILNLGLAHTPPVVAMTANAMESDRQNCLQAGMADHISKPLDPLRLQGMLYQWLGRADGPPILAGRSDPTSEAPPCFIEGVNMAAALKAVNHDQELMEKLFRSFIQQYEAFDIFAVGTEDLERELHTLKGLAATLGMTELQLLARALEQEQKKGYPLQTEDLNHLNRTVSELILRISEGMQNCASSESAQFAGSAEPEETDAAQQLRSQMTLETDRPDLPQLLDRLQGQLKDGDADAQETAIELMLSLQNTAEADLAGELLEKTDQFDFDTALNVLKQLKTSLKGL